MIRSLCLSLLFSLPPLFLRVAAAAAAAVLLLPPSPVPTPTSTVTPVTVVGLPVPTPTSTETVTVNTPGEPDTAIVPTNEYNSNYGLGNIKANAAYQRGVYGQGVTVGVVDSGALTSHEELSINLVSGRRRLAAVFIRILVIHTDTALLSPALSAV